MCEGSLMELGSQTKIMQNHNHNTKCNKRSAIFNNKNHANKMELMY